MSLYVNFNNIEPQLIRVVGSMGCVYCMWQLVFANIINNKKSSIVYRKLMCVHLVYMQALINTWHMTITYWLHYSLVMLCVVLYLCHTILLPSFYIPAGSFLTLLDLHIQIYGYFILLIKYLGSHILRGVYGATMGACVSFAWSSNFGLLCSSFFVTFIWFSIDWNQTLFHSIHRIILSCVEIHLYVILQWF